ncbi:copper chaperone PCu(A)C [Leucobacter coleopterorum]|uniref:Copper chaperone PCu(A)C n=1 Tax=Leucobacter coleopterorum TaxID=2714933 RepID=A0ABX6JWV7_9MICO|nr:copper chaperone PCu(A)C [Leucobacter coleopterorum]QIM18786.1 copper chaperone PCu(A)C [Leucobacter coleopterorum]
MFSISFKSNNPSLRKTTAITAVAALSLAAPLLLAGCSSQDTAATKADSNASSVDNSKKADSATEAKSLTAENAWAKASKADMVAGEGMTGMFVTLTNSSDKDIKITGGTSDVASMVELHEVVDGKMQEKDGGFVVPAGGTLELMPGGLHIMLMGMEKPILAGEDVHVTLELGDGSTLELHALVKDTSGANEEYSGSDDEHSMSDEHDSHSS